MFVIPLGFALGSNGDAFRAQRGKNPWVRFPSGKNKREHCSLNCDSVGIRTQGPQLRRLLLYPTELRNQHFLLSVCKWFAKRLQNYKKDWRYENSFSLFYQEGTQTAIKKAFKRCYEGAQTPLRRRLIARFAAFYLYFAIKPSARSSPSSLAFSSACRASAFCFSSPCAMPFTMYGSA